MHLTHECYEMGSNVTRSGSRSLETGNGTLFFGDVVQGDTKQYRQIPRSEVFDLIDSARIKTNQSNIVLFDEAVMHIMRVARGIGLPRGSMLLVGEGGAGRRPLSRMATALVGYKYMEWSAPDPQARVKMLDLVKDAYRLAGVRGEQVTLLVDNERRDPATLDLINQFLCTGEFPGLLTKDDLEMVLEEMRSAASLAESSGNAGSGGKAGQDTYARFINRARACFHVVLAFSPGDKFVEFLKEYPSAVRNCSLDYFIPWGYSTVLSVSATIAGVSQEFSTIDPRTLSECMATVYEQVQSFLPKYFLRTKKLVHLTPGTFLSFASTYNSVYSRRVGQTRENIRMMSAALRKLEGARTGAAAMQEDLLQKDYILAQAQVSASELLKEITDSTMKAEKKKGEVLIVKNQLADQAALIEQDRDECEKDLAAAKPSLTAAETALQSINQKDVVTLKSMKNPPAIVRTILDAMLILLHRQIRPVEVVEGGAYRDSFEYAAQVMNDESFVATLMNFPKEALTGEDVELVAPYLAHKDFQPDKVRGQSAMAAGLCLWVRALCQYQEIARQVLPKQEQLARAENQLGIANRHLQKAVDELSKCQEELDVMQARFEVAMGEKQRLSDDSRNTMSKIEAAQKLILALGGENDRWNKQVKESEEELIRCPGDSVIAAAFMDFLGAFHLHFRAQLIKDISAKCVELGIKVSPDADPHRFFATKADIREWVSAGLDADSLQNGTLVVHSSRWPIVIDPQRQALNWIRSLDKDMAHAHVDEMVEGIHSGEKTLLEDCLVAGRSMVLSEVDGDLDPSFDKLISKTFTSTGKRLSVNLGGRDVEFTPSFRLILCCPTDHHFDAYTSSLTNIIDFSMTLKGLESQLLTLVLEEERSDLHRHKLQVTAVLNQHEKELEDLNNALLHRLSGAEGNLLDDEALMTVLSTTKEDAVKALTSIREVAETQQGIDKEREEYRPVALRGALLFFAANDMAPLCSIYHFSLPSFLKLFTDAVRNAENVMSRQSRVPAIVASATKAISDFSRLIYFSMHFEVFKLMTALKVAQHEHKTIQQDQIFALTKAGQHVQLFQVSRKPKEWMSDSGYCNLLALAERIPRFHGIVEVFVRKDAWRVWIEKDRPEEEPCPDGDQLDAMHKFLLIRAMREDRFIAASRMFVASVLGPAQSEGRAELTEVVGVSSSATPIICISRGGYDPSPPIIALAKRKHKRIVQIPLGSDREEELWKTIVSEMEIGGWVLLQNGHVDVPLLNRLYKRLADSTGVIPSAKHSSFRLWITILECEDISVHLLLSSVRASFEPPEGIRAGMHALYTEMVDQDVLDSLDSGKDWSRLIYTLSYLHCILRERSRYGKAGWSEDEAFGVMDWHTCISFLRDHMLDKGAKEIRKSAWLGIRYMINEVHIGSNIIDDWDKRIAMVYTDRLFPDDSQVSTTEWFTGFARPDSTHLQDHMDTILGLREDTPEMYGLGALSAPSAVQSLYVSCFWPKSCLRSCHPSPPPGPHAESVLCLKQGQAVIQCLCQLEARSNGNSRATRQNQADDNAANIISKLPATWKADYIAIQVVKLGSASPLVMFLIQVGADQNKITRRAFFASDFLHCLKGTSSLLDADPLSFAYSRVCVYIYIYIYIVCLFVCLL